MPEAPGPEPILVASGVAVRYSARSDWAVRDADLGVGAGAAIGIVGESGSGKSTLARVLAGSLRPTCGTVRVLGREWSTVSRREAPRRMVQMIFQDPYSALNPAMSALDAVAEAIAHWDRVRHAEATRRAAELLTETGLSGEAIMKRPRRLSGGQCQRVGIARALACRPEVLIADEPTSALDVSVQAQILNLLGRLRDQRGLALVMISHDLSVVRYLTDSALVMCRGEIVERGPTAAIFSSPQHAYTRQLLDALPGARNRDEHPAASASGGSAHGGREQPTDARGQVAQ